MYKEDFESLNNCYLQFIDWYLTCTYNHNEWDYCLMDRCDYCSNFDCKCYDE